MSRTVEEIFRDAYHVGERYESFKILIVGEYGPDFSASHQENTGAFREHMHSRYVQEIIDAFDAAATELGLSLEEIDHAEFFAYYNYYWNNAHRSEISSDEKIDPKDYLTRLVDELGARLIISAGGVGDERFRREIFIRHGAEFLERPIFVNANRETLKEIFKVYLRTCRTTGMDETFDRLAAQIAEGKSPLDVLDEIYGGVVITNYPDRHGRRFPRRNGFNTFPFGVPSDLYPELLVVCEDPMTLAEPHRIFNNRRWHADGVFNYIDWWCQETQGRFPARRVKLLTDKWTTEAYKRYEILFRRLAKNERVSFEFHLYMLGARPVKINLPF